MKKIEVKLMADDRVMVSIGEHDKHLGSVNAFLTLQEASQLEQDLFNTINKFLKDYEANQSNI